MSVPGPKICVVTGANVGIGLETARGLLNRGATVVLACRDVEKAEAAKVELMASTKKQTVEVLMVDLADLLSIRSAADSIAQRFGRVDVLVNNAGLWATERHSTIDGFELNFGVNHLGPMAFTCALLPSLKAAAPSRVVMVSSGLHYKAQMQWADLQSEKSKFDGGAAYRQSKLANVLFANALARQLAGTGVTVNSLAPGVVATQLWRHMKPGSTPAPDRLISPAKGALCSLHVALNPSLEKVTGRYFEKQNEKPAAPQALNLQDQDRLWQVSAELLAAKGFAISVSG